MAFSGGPSGRPANLPGAFVDSRKELSTISPPPPALPGRRILGVLAGGDLPLGRLAAWADSAETILAADAGVSRLLACGRDADVVVGDLDSARSEDLARTRAEVIRVADQETTDAEKLLALAAGRRIAGITLAGLEGDRLDHLLAALYAGVASGLEVSVALRAMWGRIVRAGESVSFGARPGTVVSLLPLAAAEGVSLRGVRWPVSPEGNGRSFAADGRFSVSNEALGPISAAVERGTVLLLVGTDGEPIWL